MEKKKKKEEVAPTRGKAIAWHMQKDEDNVTVDIDSGGG